MDCYQRIEKFKIDDILPILKNVAYSSKPRIIFKGVPVKISDPKYIIFKKNTNCYLCGIEGSFIALERKLDQPELPYIFNLYAVNKNNEEILMTKDHIFPKSMGGRNDISNLETCCERCNNTKGSKIIKYKNKLNGYFVINKIRMKKIYQFKSCGL
ncbi:MAG: HNH endonuclease [Magnetococcus sp. YQC-3]